MNPHNSISSAPSICSSFLYPSHWLTLTSPSPAQLGHHHIQHNMCRTVHITTICPRCMNPYTTRKGEFGTTEYNTVTIPDSETIVCSYAFDTRQICASAMTDTYDDGTKHPIPGLDRLGEDFCCSCLSRPRLHINTMPAPLLRRAQWSSFVSEWAQTPRSPPQPEPKPGAITESQQKAGNSTKLDIVKGGIDYLGYPIRNRQGLKPNIWIDVLDGNHIMAVPSRKGKNKTNKNTTKGKGIAKTGKDTKNTRCGIWKNARKPSNKANQKVATATLSTPDLASKNSVKLAHNDLATMEAATPEVRSKRVRFGEVTERPAKDGVNTVNKKENKRKSLHRKAKGKQRAADL